MPTASETPSIPVTESPLPSATSSPSDQPQQNYRDSRYGFEVSYPAHFLAHVLSDAQTANFGEDGFLRSVTYYDRQYEGKEPPGSANVRIYEKGASNSLDEWVRSHSAPESDPPNDKVYFRETVNLREATVAGRQGVRFEWDAGELGTVQAAAFFYKTYVAYSGWYTETPDYDSTIEAVFERMLASWKDG